MLNCSHIGKHEVNLVLHCILSFVTWTRILLFAFFRISKIRIVEKIFKLDFKLATSPVVLVSLKNIMFCFVHFDAICTFFLKTKYSYGILAFTKSCPALTKPLNHKIGTKLKHKTRHCLVEVVRWLWFTLVPVGCPKLQAPRLQRLAALHKLGQISWSNFPSRKACEHSNFFGSETVTFYKIIYVL